ncbi:MAG: aldo/keto reductase [Capsulimonadaceae bacterium]|nr:aldo/keto reductase [Capsulimonadaceae bacterium]
MTQMQYLQIPGAKKPVSRLIQGTTMTGPLGDKVFDLFDAALENGINTFDTAQVYGNEPALGKWIADRGVRDRVNILTKGAHHNDVRRRVTPWDITADIYDSLGRLKVDYIDIYILHRDDPSFPVGPIVETLNEHHKAGRIGVFGGSNWTHARIAEVNAYAKEHGLTPFAISNPNFNLVDMIDEPWAECVSIGGEQGRKAREYYATADITLFTWSTLAGGFLSGKVTRDKSELPEGRAAMIKRCYYSEDNFKRLDRARELAASRGLSIPQVALAYVLSQSARLATLIAPETPDEIADNTKALDVKLSAKEIAWLELREDSL